MKNLLLYLVSGLTLCALCSCSSMSGGDRLPLRVGMTPNIAPILFKQNGKLTGLEIDLARELGRELGRPVHIVELAWNEQIPALTEGRTDIIMSGMSVTDTRKIRIAFSTPWLQSGLMALIASTDKETNKTPADLAASSGKIGVMPGTTGSAFVQRNYAKSRAVLVYQPEDIAFLIQRRSIEFFVHDAPSVLWQLSRHEAFLAVIPEPLNREEIAWGLRREDTALLNSVNATIAKWQTSGLLDKLIRKWIPYYDQLLAAPVATP